MPCPHAYSFSHDFPNHTLLIRDHTLINFLEFQMKVKSFNSRLIFEILSTIGNPIFERGWLLAALLVRPSRGRRGDIFEKKSLFSVMKAICCQHVVSLLPPCCQHVASMLPACCQHVASMLPACCLHVVILFLACCQYVVKPCFSYLLECC